MHGDPAVCLRALTRISSLVVLVLALFWSDTAAGQGTSNMLPDPISTRELLEYSKRLGLSDQQQQAFLLKHDRYKQEFEKLRQGEIAEFLKEMRAISGSMPQRKELEDFLQKMDKLQSAIKRLDSNLFDSVIPLLTERQLVMLPRIRLDRDRNRYPMQSMMWGQQGPMVDVSELVRDLELSEEEILRVDPQLALYERNLTRAMESLHESSLRMWLDIFDALEARGFSEDDFQDPEKAGKAMETMQQVFREVAAEARSKAVAIGDLSKKTYEAAQLQLTESNARKLRQIFVARRYPELNLLDANLRLQLAYFTRRRDISDEVRRAAAEIAQQHDRQIQAIENDGIELIDKWREESDQFAFQDGSYTEFNSKLSELRTKANEVHASTLRQLSELLDGEMYASLTSVQFDDKGDIVDAEAQGKAGDASNDELVEDSVAEHSVTDIDEFVIAPISARELSVYADLMSLDDGQRAVMNELHTTYLEQCDLIKSEKIRPIADRLKRYWSQDEGVDKAEIVERNYADRISATESMRAADKQFFDEIDLLVVNDDQRNGLERARQLRERATYSVARNYSSWVSASQEASVDLAAIVGMLGLSQGTLDASVPILDEYIQATTPLLRDRFTGSLEMNRANMAWQVRSQQAVAEGEEQPNFLEYQESLKQPFGKLHRATRELRQINARTLDRMVEAADAEDKERLRDAYYRKAFPGLMDDAAAAGPYLDHATRLSSLTPQQREQVHELALGYHEQYEQYTAQLIESQRIDMPNWYDGEDQEAQQAQWKAYQEQQEKREAIEFQRKELNDRLLGQLWIILTEEQRGEIRLTDLQLVNSD